MKARKGIVVTDRREYHVDGGAVLDQASGASRVDLLDEDKRGVSLFVPRTDLSFYPIGAKVRVTIERIA
jgi:hypothetical protein